MGASDSSPSPEFSERRAPPPRRAVFFGVPFRWWAGGVVLAGLLLAGLVAFSEPPSAADGATEVEAVATREKLPTPPVDFRQKGVAYTDARAFLGKLGFRSEKSPEANTLRLRGPAGRELLLSQEKREARLDGMRVFLGEPVLLEKDVWLVATLDLERFLLPIFQPDRLPPAPATRTIVLDAGHGGNDTGTSNRGLGLEEKAFTLDVAERLRALLHDEERWRVVLTRTDDAYIALGDRARRANEEKADLFVSIHFNAVANNSAVHGTETYVLTPRYQRSTSSDQSSPDDNQDQVGNRHDAWSAVLGYQMHRHLLSRLKTADRGYKRARFAVLRLVDCPAVLVEAGYLSNDAEAKKIGREDYRRAIAEALHDAIISYDAARQSAAGE